MSDTFNRAESIPTIKELVGMYLDWLAKEVRCGRSKLATLNYYRRQLARFQSGFEHDVTADKVRAWDLELVKTGWHSVQAVQRLFNWAVDFDLILVNPVRRVQRPPLRQRRRVMNAIESARVLRAAHPALRRYLLALRHTIARPHEIRGLNWWQFKREPVPAFLLHDFKLRERRRDPNAVRFILIDRRLLRLLDRLHRKFDEEPEGHVFTNSEGRPWTKDTVARALARIRQRLGLHPDRGGENVVPYTFRHTAATLASANGVRDAILAELMGHTTTRTTRRYQHLDIEHLAGRIDQATRRRRA